MESEFAIVLSCRTLTVICSKRVLGPPSEVRDHVKVSLPLRGKRVVHTGSSYNYSQSADHKLHIKKKQSESRVIVQ